METYLDIYDVKKNSQEQDKHGENCEKYFFVLFFIFFFKILAINCTETLGGCPQLVTELSRVCP